MTNVNETSRLAWRKFVVPHTQLQTAAVTNTKLLLTLPAGNVIHRTFIYVTQAFTGTTTLTLSVGTAGDNLKFAVAQSALSTGLLNGVGLTAPLPESMSAGTDINLYAVSTVQNLSSLTQGSADIYILISQL